MWRQGRVCWLVLICLILIGLSIKVYSICFGAFIFFNKSPSAPIGFYIKAWDQHLSYGDYVNVHLPMDIPSLHVEKNHLLLKRIAGFPGDPYDVTKDTLTIHEQSYPIAHYSYLPHLAPGHYAVPEGQILFLNPPEISFDGRYLGPIPMENIEEKVVLLIDMEKLLDGIENTIPIIKRLGDDPNAPPA